MRKLKKIAKRFAAMFFCGMAAIELFPTSDYTKLVPASSMSMMKASWEMAGEAMRGAIEKVGGQVGEKHKES